MSNSAAALMEICPEMEAGKACELLGVTLEDVLAELAYRKRQRGEKMRLEMALAAKAGGERRIMRDGEQGGYVDAMFHPTSYHYWGQRLGYECWDDPQFVAEYKRDNPEARVRQRNARTFSFAGIEHALLRGPARPAPVKGLVQGRATTRDERLLLKAS